MDKTNYLKALNASHSPQCEWTTAAAAATPLDCRHLFQRPPWQIFQRTYRNWNNSNNTGQELIKKNTTPPPSPHMRAGWLGYTWSIDNNLKRTITKKNQNNKNILLLTTFIYHRATAVAADSFSLFQSTGCGCCCPHGIDYTGPQQTYLHVHMCTKSWSDCWFYLLPCLCLLSTTDGQVSDTW